MADPALEVRPARLTDAETVAHLLYESSGGVYDRFAGGRRRAHRVLECAFALEGNNASAEVVTVAELDGRVVAALASFPVDETARRAVAFLRIVLRTIPPWRWPSALWLYWAGARAAPAPPRQALYIDALATDDSARRRGAARALLEQAEREARRLELPTLALDTSLDNRAARSLYVGAGYQEVAYRAPAHGLPGYVALLKPVR